MFSTRSLLLGLALATAAPMLLVSVEPAQAADPVAASGVVAAIMPVPAVEADGKSEIPFKVAIVDGRGKPVKGASLKVTASKGDASGWTEIGNGLYTFKWKAHKGTKAEDVTVTLTGKLTDLGATVDTKYTFRAKRPGSNRVSGSTNPAKVVLGKDTDASLSLTGAPLKGDMVVRASAGEVTNLTNMGEGKWTARFQPPSTRFPQVGIVAVADPSDPLTRRGFVTVPMSGSVDYPVVATADSSVILRIGDRDFGPVKAGSDGAAKVPIVVPPGVSAATLVTVVDGEKTEKPLDLRVPDTLRMVSFPLPSAIPGDSGVTIPIRVIVMEAGGDPDTKAKLLGTASKGTLGEFKHVQKGVYKADYTPPDMTEAGTVDFEVSIDGAKAQKDNFQVTMLAQRATSVGVETDPASMDSGTKDVVVRIAARSAGGKPVTGQTVTTTMRGGSAEKAQDAGGGDYTVAVKRDDPKAEVSLVVLAPVSPNPVRHVVVLPATNSIKSDGKSSAEIVVVSVDAFGYPVPNVDVKLESKGGGAKLPAGVKTDANGIGRVELTAGRGRGLVRIAASAGRATGAGALFQGIAKMPSGVSAPADVQAIYNSWSGAVQTVRLYADPTAAPKLVMASAGTATATLEVSFFPEEVGPGGSVTIRSVPKSAEGEGIPGEELDVLTSLGDLGTTTEALGVYDTVLTLGAEATGTAKVSVVAASGVMRLVKVPINPDAAVAVAAVDPADEPKEDVAEEPKEDPKEDAVAKVEKPPKEKAEAGEYPWLRARVSGTGSLYRYSQSPSNNPGPLIPSALTVGDGSRPATPVGAEIHARAWAPDMPYVGGIVSLRSAWYAISSSAFDQNAPDWLYDANVMAAVRYPFQVAEDQYWIGGKAGFHYDDFMLFTGCLEPGCEVNFDPLGMPGLGLGAELGADLGTAPVYFVGGYTHALANFTVPYMNAIDANIGFGVADNVDVDVGFSWIDRKVVLEGVDSGDDRGELADGQVVFKLGLGYSM